MPNGGLTKEVSTRVPAALAHQEPVTGEEPSPEQDQDAQVREPGRVQELVATLQRLGAEYANYRKRAERDRDVAARHATARLLTGLLPVLDTLDRAEAHDELTGTLATVAGQLRAAVAEAGIERIGQPGETFDPTWHQAVEHTHQPDVLASQPVVAQVYRPGYRLGEQSLRPAVVAVAEPALANTGGEHGSQT